MSTAGGGVFLLGEIRHLILGHEFLPSSSYVTNRARFTWRAQATTNSVQWREADTVSESLLDGIAKELYADNENMEKENSRSSGKNGTDCKNVASSVPDKSMANYIQTISSLKEQRSSEASRKAVAVERPIVRDVYKKQRSVGPNEGGIGVDMVKKDKIVSKHEASSKQKTINLVRRLEAGSFVRSILEKSELKFTARESSFILNGLKSPKKVLEVFEWLRESGKSRGNIYAYNIVYKILGARQEWSRIDELLGSMEQDSCVPDEYTFNTLIMSASKAESVDNATNYFRLMLEKAVAPTKMTYSMMMLLYQKFGKVREAEVVFSHMLQSGVQVVTAYSAMIATYTRDGCYKKAEKIMKDMEDSEIAPDRDNWLKQLNAFGQQGKLEEAAQIKETVEKLGISLGVVGYNALITAYGKAGQYDRVLSLVEEMKAKDLEPDEVTYSCMIGACGRAGKLKDALAYFEEMKKLNILPRLSNFNTLISLYGRQRIWLALSAL